MACRRWSRHWLSSLLLAALAPWLGATPPVGAQETPAEVLVETKLVAADAVDGDGFGQAIAIDGDVMVVAAPGADAGDAETSGAVYVLLRDPTTGEWVEHQQLVPADGHYDDNFLEMRLAIDGDTIVVGAPYADVAAVQDGAVHVFERGEGGDWSPVVRLIEPVGNFGHFGDAVAIDGGLLAVGAPQTTFSGHGVVGIYERDRGGADAWGRIATLYGYANFVSAVDDAGHVRSFGSAVAIDGDLLLVGASDTSVSFTDMQDGATYVFRRNETDPDQWDYVTRMIAPGADSCVGGRKLSVFSLESTVEERIEAQRCASEDIHTSYDGFAETIALHGDLVAIGAPTAEGEDDGTGVGAVHLFRRDPADDALWDHVVTHIGSTASEFSYFGRALALDDDRLIVGADGTTIDTRIRQGGAHVLERDAGGADAWGETETLIAFDGFGGAHFGRAVAWDGVTRIVGADGDQTGRGAVYLHTPVEEPPPPEEGCQPAAEVTAELVDGAIVEHDSGVLLGTVEGTLTEPLAVWIHEVVAPDVPLFANAVPVRLYYNIGAECTTFGPLEAPFGVALPVPVEADTSRLGVAVLAPPASVFDGPAESTWHPVTGLYDAENRLYTLTLDALWTEGSTFVLVEHPDLAPLPPSAAVRTPPATDDEPANPDFEVSCFGFAHTLHCDSPEEQAVRAALITAYWKFNRQGFPDPALKSKTMKLGDDGLFVSATYTAYYDIRILPIGADPAVCTTGSPAAYNGTLFFCKTEGFWDRMHLYANHEFFHAIQASYALARKDWNKKDSAWMIEGTANTAERSDDTMRRDDQNALRRIDVALNAPRSELSPDRLFPYETQDFWVHLLRSNGRDLPLGELDSFFRLGATTAAVAERLGQPNDPAFVATLGDHYWDWVKNQAIEKSFDFDGALTYPCERWSGATLWTTIMLHPASSSYVATIDNFTSRIIRISFSDPVDGVTVLVEGGPPDAIRYKVYTEDDESCAELPDGDAQGRRFEHLDAGAELTVLIANTQHQGEPPIAYQVLIRLDE